MDDKEFVEWRDYRLYVIKALEGNDQKTDRIRVEILDRLDKMETKIEKAVKSNQEAISKNTNRLVAIETKAGVIGGIVAIAVAFIIEIVLKIVKL